MTADAEQVLDDAVDGRKALADRTGAPIQGCHDGDRWRAADGLPPDVRRHTRDRGRVRRASS